MLSKHAYFPSSMDSATIIKHVAVITDTLLYLDGSMDKIQSRAHCGHYKKFPEVLGQAITERDRPSSKNVSTTQLSQELQVGVI